MPTCRMASKSQRGRTRAFVRFARYCVLHLLGEYFYAFWGGRCRGCLLWGSPLEGEVRMVLACFPKPRDILGEYLSYIGSIDQVVVRRSFAQFPIALELECLVELLQKPSEQSGYR